MSNKTDQELLAEAIDNQFPPRVRFNWGYHDAVADSQRGNPRSTVEKGEQNIKTVSKQFNQHYYHGYKKGLEHFQAGSHEERSDRAWNEHKAEEKDAAASRKALKDARPDPFRRF